MLGRMKENRKKLIILILFFDLILICVLYGKTDRYDGTTAAMLSPNMKDQYNQLLVNTYLTEIMEASDNFYDGYYTISPIVNYYSVFVKKVSADGRTYYVTFTSNPYLGPHDTIGNDEITFSADYLGNVKLESFNHLKSYHLPDNLKDLEKKQFPGKYYD